MLLGAWKHGILCIYVETFQFVSLNKKKKNVTSQKKSTATSEGDLNVDRKLIMLYIKGVPRLLLLTKRKISFISFIYIFYIYNQLGSILFYVAWKQHMSGFNKTFAMNKNLPTNTLWPKARPTFKSVSYITLFTVLAALGFVVFGLVEPKSCIKVCLRNEMRWDLFVVSTPISSLPIERI